MTHPLQSVTDELNAMLAEAGAVDAAGDPMRWTLDTDGESNSAGTWFCGTLGGVTDEASMREHTARIIERRQAAQKWAEIEAREPNELPVVPETGIPITGEEVGNCE